MLSTPNQRGTRNLSDATAHRILSIGKLMSQIQSNLCCILSESWVEHRLILS